MFAESVEAQNDHLSATTRNHAGAAHLMLCECRLCLPADVLTTPCEPLTVVEISSTYNGN
jgi:hypothetical protein